MLMDQPCNRDPVGPPWFDGKISVAGPTGCGLTSKVMKPVFDQLGTTRAAGPPSREVTPDAMEMFVGSNSSTRQFHSTRRMMPWVTTTKSASESGASKSRGKRCKFRKFAILRLMEAVDSLSMWGVEVDAP